MRNLGLLLAGSFVLVAAAGCGVPDVQQDGFNPETLKKVGLECYWPLQLVLKEGEGLVGIELLDEKLYCRTTQKRIIAVDAATGEQKWAYEEFTPTDHVFRPYHVDGLLLAPAPLNIAEITGFHRRPATKPIDAVLFNTAQRVVVLDRATGKERRNIQFRFSANSGGACDGRYFYVGSTLGRYHAFALNEGLKAWHLKTGAMISAPIAVSGIRVFVGSEDHEFYSARQGAQGKVVWRQKLEGAIRGAFHVDERGSFVPSEGNRLYAFGNAHGNPLWPAFVFQGPAITDVQVGENTLFQYASNDALYAINIANGRERWRRKDGRGIVAMIDGDAYMATAGKNLVVLDELLGKEKYVVSLRGLDMLAGNIKAPAIYASTIDGKIYCIRPSGAEPLTADSLLGQ